MAKQKGQTTNYNIIHVKLKIE